MKTKRIRFNTVSHGLTEGGNTRDIAEDRADLDVDFDRRVVWVVSKNGNLRYAVPFEALASFDGTLAEAEGKSEAKGPPARKPFQPREAS